MSIIDQAAKRLEELRRAGIDISAATAPKEIAPARPLPVEPETALELFQAIVRSVAKADPAYLRTQREWFEIAKREIGA